MPLEASRVVAVLPAGAAAAQLLWAEALQSVFQVIPSCFPLPGLIQQQHQKGVVFLPWPWFRCYV